MEIEEYHGSGFGASSMDYLLSNIFQLDQSLDHDGELLQIACVPCLEHEIQENHNLLPRPLGTSNPNPKRDPDDQDHHHLMGHSQISFCQPSKRKSSSITFGKIEDDRKPKENNKVKKIMHRDIERQRRQEMATLYASLRSHLPLEYLKGKRAISDHVHQATNYIKHLQNNMEKLVDKRDGLKKSCNILQANTAGMINLQLPVMGERDSVTIVVGPACTGVEVIVNTSNLKQGLPLSKVIGVMVGDGLSIVSCNLARVNKRLLYTIESEVSDGRSIDHSELQQRLMNKCT